MTFIQGLMRVLAAAGASALVVVIPQLSAFFQGSAPSDISPVVWGVISTIAVFGLNLLLGKFGPQRIP